MDTVTGLRLFIRVVETGSFSKAALESGITQPTATKAVAAMEQRLGARLLHRTTRGVSPTEVGTLYYDKCKSITHEIEAADNLASLMQSGVGGTLRVSTSVAFGRRVLVPLSITYMREHPTLTLDLSFDDRYVNMVEQGVDLAIRMGRLADSTLGARYLGRNPWVLVASPAYLKQHAAPQTPADVAAHPCLIYSSVQGDERWHFTGGAGTTGASDGHDAPREQSVAVHGPLRTNNLSVVLEAALGGMGLAILPWYVAHHAVRAGRVMPLLADHALPVQEMHAVFPSPKLVPSKVASFIDFLQGQFTPEWWKGAA